MRLEARPNETRAPSPPRRGSGVGRRAPVRRKRPPPTIKGHTRHRDDDSPHRTHETLHLCGELSPDDKYAKAFIKDSTFRVVVNWFILNGQTR